MIHHRFVLLAVVVATASCNPRASVTAEPITSSPAPALASVETSAAPVPAVEHRIPNVCAVFGPPHCVPCPGSSCPQEDSGLLCCNAVACVVAGPTDCAANDLYWCSNYSTQQDPATGISVATCHDSAE
jgi:hypothetical protein